MCKLMVKSIILILLILGCASMEVGERMSQFDETSRAYIRAIRWGIISEDQFKIIQIVDFQYYRMKDVTVNTLIDRQRWEYDQEQEKWFLQSNLPAF